MAANTRVRSAESSGTAERQVKRQRANAAAASFTELDAVRRVRPSTFSHWPHPEPFRRQMIEAGFFGCNNGDRANCIYCNLICHQWDDKLDDPCEVHKTRSPNCLYVKLMSCCHSLQYDEIVSTFPIHKHYVDPQKRSATFSARSYRGDPSGDELAEAGFFYEDSTLVCFYCNGVLENSALDNHPVAEHVRQFPHCNYARQLCGEHLYYTIQLFKKNSSEDVDTVVCANTRRNVMPLDESMITKYVAAHLDESMSVNLLNSGRFDKSIIQQCWFDQLRLKGEDFVDAAQLFVACEILKGQRKILAVDERNILIPRIALQDIYERRKNFFLANSNRTHSDIMASFGNDYQAYRNARKISSAQFTEDEETTIQREHSLYNWSLDEPSRCQMMQGGWLMYDREHNATRCPHCHMQYSNWKADDNPLLIHQHLAPLCPFVLSSNPMNQNPASVGTVAERYTDEVIAAAASQPYVGLVQIRHGSNASVANRQLSFSNLPRGCRLDTDALAGYGLYYTNLQRSINCFYCTRRMPFRSCIPWSNSYFKQQHPPSRCRYMQQFNDQDPVPSTQPASKKCTWCLTDDKRLLALPCRHHCVCEACGRIKRLCAKCKETVTAYVVVYCS